MSVVCAEGPKLEIIKPGREAHTLLERAFFYGLMKITELFKEKNINYSLYGGTSYQLLFTYALMKQQGKNCLEEVVNLSEYLRPTSDFDFIFSEDVRKNIFEIISELAPEKCLEESFGREAYSLKVVRVGEKRLVIDVIGVTERKISDVNIWVNLTYYLKEDDWHKEMLEEENQLKISLKYDKEGLLKLTDVKVSKPEYTAVGKLLRLNKEKDIFDLLTALQLLEIDIKKIDCLLRKERKKLKGEKLERINEILRALNGGKKGIEKYLNSLAISH